ncbi:MAG: asparagine synthase (glutamine-hydrolyzing) [Bacteroidia bacterium]|nr:asparagine synthase (glutamine-hydrolyzing) [Bacteroidia bacterium]
MCGISGIYHFNSEPVSENKLKAFTDSMLHRGPDGAGYEWFDDNTLGLGQRRLAILDLSESGKQPMSYADDRYWITYNGEIFNFPEIRRELEQKGHKFRSETDTEVILAAYAEWGKSCLHKFNGMWAFAIWDTQERELFLARDRFGIKPLYYLHQPDKQFAFASETRAFKFLEDFKREFDESLLQLNLQDAYALEGLGYTPFKNILQLLPAHYLVVKKGQPLQQKRWWHIDEHLQEEIPKTLEKQAAKFYELLRDACRIRLVSDVPVATALSGGLDSSSVYSLVSDILQKESLGRVNKDSQRAFTAIFPGLPQNEHEYALKAASFCGGKIETIETDIDSLPSKIQQETELADFISTSPITSISAVYAGMKRSGITVSMDGHGVDEMLYGYRDMVYAIYNHALWQGSVQQTQDYSQVLQNMYHPEMQFAQQQKFAQALTDKKARESTLKFRLKNTLGIKPKDEGFFPADLPSLSDKPYDFSGKSLPERMLYYEFFQHTLPALLRNFDRAGMMNSVEIRMPFMDWRLVSYVFSLPVGSKIGQGFTKLIVREAMKNRMDETVRTRTFKVGIGSPVEHWFNGSLKEWVLDSVKEKQQREELFKAYKSGGLNTAQVRDAWLGINMEMIN